MAAENLPHVPERICALYSKGPHYVRLLKRLRAEYPDETIVAAVPQGYPVEIVAGLVNETITFPGSDSGNPLLRGFRVVRLLRRARCSHIVVMFDSPRLNLLARLSGASKRWCFSADTRLRPLSRALPRLIAAPAWLRLCGEVDYLRARLGTARRNKNHD